MLMSGFTPTALSTSRTLASRSARVPTPAMTIGSATMSLTMRRRVERGDRILKYDLEPAADMPHLVARNPGKLGVLEDHLAGGRPGELEYGPARGGFSAAGFAHQPEGLALGQIEVHVLNRRETAALGGVLDGQVPDREDRPAGHAGGSAPASGYQQA